MLNKIAVQLSVLLTFIVLYKTYDSYFNNKLTTEKILILLHQENNKKLFKEIKSIKNKESYKAIAFAVDSEDNLVCWYTYAMNNQKFANTIALKNCNNASKKLDVNKECKLYNEIFSRI